MKSIITRSFKQIIAFVSLTMLHGQTSAQTLPTLCSRGEEVIFSCQVRNKKIISYCAIKSQNKKDTLVQYRFGHKNKKPELVYPEDDELSSTVNPPLPSSAFRIFQYPESSAANESPDAFSISLDFEEGDYLYSLNSQYSRNKSTSSFSSSDGFLVSRIYAGPKVVLARYQCIESTTQNKIHENINLFKK